VFWNLIQNATKFTPTGGQIAVHSWRTAERAVIEVRDTGIGIEAGQLERVFSAFEQASSGRARRFGGLGLGLTISKALVQLHDGVVSAHSAGCGQGATFRVELPLCATAAKSEPPQAAPVAAPASAGARILLVEDHADTARMMARLLRGAGHDVATAGSVAEALTIANQASFDLLISDLGLPDRSGLELVRDLRARGISMPAIAMTGYGQEEDLLHSRAAGFAAHLTKPINLELLELTLAKTLRR
jgi:CheY-like chemotaxis protein